MKLTLIISIFSFILVTSLSVAAANFTWYSQGAAPNNGYLYIKEIQTELNKKIVVKCTRVNDGGYVMDMQFWYDCQWGECDNSLNTNERAKQIFATLLAAQSSDSKIDINFTNTGTELFFRSVKIVK